MANKNYIAAKIKYSKAKAYQKIKEHNERLKKIDYLLREQAKKLNIEYEDKYKNQNINFYNLEQMQQKRKRKPQKNENEIIETIIVFSEEQSLKYLKNDDDTLLKISQQIALNFKKIYGFEPMQIDLHRDEGYIDKDTKQIKYNFHAHLVLYNYDFEKNKTVLRTLRKQDFRDMQDLAEQSAKEAGFDFRRGEKKEYTNARHLKTQEFREARKVLNVFNFLEKNIKSIDEEKKKIRNNLNLSNEEIKELNKSLTKQKRLLAAELKEIKKNVNGYDFDNTKDIIKNIFQKFLKQNIELKGIINKNKYIKAEKIIPLFQNITDNMEKNINENFFNGNFEKTEILKNENRKLEEETEKIKRENEELKRENELLLSSKKINKEYAKKLKEEKEKVENINNNLSSNNETLKKDLEIKKEIITEIREKNIIIKNYYDDIKKLYELNISKIETFKELNKELKEKFEALAEAKKPYISSLRRTNDIANAMLLGGIPIMVNMLIDVYNYQNKLNNQSIKKDIEKLKKKKEQLSKKIGEGFEEYNFLKEEVKKVKKEKEELKEKIKPKRKIQMRTI